MTFRSNICCACGGTGKKQKIIAKTKLKTVGERFGIVTVTKLLGRDQNGVLSYEYRCDCGNIGKSSRSNLIGRNSSVRSCGCLKRKATSKRNRTHGLSKTPEYEIWSGIKKRCFNSRYKDFKYYGGRGIGMSPRWNHFINFLKDMGKRPSKKHGVDRINNNGDYSPENCRWAIHETQMNNTRRNVYVSYMGKKMTMAQYAKAKGINYERARLKFHKNGKITDGV